MKDAKLVPDEQSSEGEKLKQLAEKRYSGVIKLVGEEILGQSDEDSSIFLQVFTFFNLLQIF